MTGRYDLLAIDLDGTLLSRDGSISARNLAAIRAAHDAGLQVIIATGRAYLEADGALRAAEVVDRLIGAGGAILNDAQTGHTLDRSAMPHELAHDVARSLIRHGHLAHLLKDGGSAGYDYLIVGDGPLDPATEWWFEHLPVRVRFVDDLEADEHPGDTIRVSTVAVGSELSVIAAELQRDLGPRAFLQHWSAVTESEAVGSTTHLLECFNPDVNKWTMIERYCAANGLDPARTAAIGDGLNDLDMVRRAGLGVAMANADPRILSAARHVTADHDADGVAEAIDHILEGRW